MHVIITSIYALFITLRSLIICYSFMTRGEMTCIHDFIKKNDNILVTKLHVYLPHIRRILLYILQEWEISWGGF